MAIDYSKWSESDLKALAKNDYSNLSSEALQQLTSETPVSQGGQHSTLDQAANLGGQVVAGAQAMYEHTAKPVIDFAISHPIESGALGSMIPGLNRIPGLSNLADARRALYEKYIGSQNKIPPATPPAETPRIQVPESVGSGPRTTVNYGTPGDSFKILQTPQTELNSGGMQPNPNTPPVPSAPGGSVPANSQPNMLQRAGQLAQQYAPIMQRIAPYAARGSALVGGLAYSPSLNTGEDAALQRQRAQLDQQIRAEAARKAGITVPPQ